jgi:hypothetical protein
VIFQRFEKALLSSNHCKAELCQVLDLAHDMKH